MPSLLQRPPARTPGPVRSLPPAAAPPSPPRPLIPPGLPPPSVFVGEKGGRSRGVRSGFPALGRAGGRFRRLRYGPAHVRHTWARLPAWLYKPCATLSRRFLLSEERPVRRAPAGRNATPLCARRTTCSAVRHERPTIQRDARPRHPGLCVLHGRQGGCAAGGSLVRRFSRSASPCRSCCIVLWSLLGFASVRVCALGSRRKRRSWSSPEKPPFTQAITTEIEQKTVAKSEKTTERS